ncbi:MAG: InlB B-repeat-containing protein, partial [Lachnospiraceae bacterium]|nr:InlB B-repeat-containing protein [Lachnospiraceae bacterium]
IVSMIFTTGGFATLADSVSDVIETSESGKISQAELSHKYYDDLVGASDDVGETFDESEDSDVGAKLSEPEEDDAGAKLSEPEEKEDEPSSNEYAEEPEDDGTTVSSDAEQDFDGEETTTVEVTTEELTSETTVIVNEETTTTNINEEPTSTTIIPEETTTTEPTTVVPKEITNTESSSTATDSEISDAENQTENNISTSSDAVEDVELNKETATNSETFDISLSSNSETTNINLQEIGIASLSEISLASSFQLFGAGSFPSHIWFGSYPQHDTSGVQYEPIKWKVYEYNTDLDTIIDANTALLVSENILDNVPFNNSYAQVNWVNSSIKSWLNNDFINSAFTTNLINSDAIHTKSILYDDHPEVMAWDSGNKAVLMRIDDISWVSSVCHDNSLKIAQSSNYARRNGTLLESDGNSPWWILQQSQNIGTANADALSRDGTIEGYSVDSNQVGVRPVMFINLNSQVIKMSNNTINWDLNGAEWKTESALWGEMNTYQGGQKLPTADNLNIPEGKYFFGWIDINNPDTIITEIPTNTTGELSLKAQIADSILLGTYPQNSTNSDVVEPIKWRILKRDGNELLLLSDKILDNKSFHSTDTAGTSNWVTWRDSDIRSWLNNEFKEKMFPQSQIDNLIKEKQITTRNYHQDNGYSDNVTNDKIILLYYTDVENWTTDADKRKSEGTTYATTKENYGMRLDAYYHNGYYPYWLRGESVYHTSNIIDPPTYNIVNEAGTINREGRVGHSNQHGTGGIRPAIYIDMSSSFYLSPSNTLTWEFESQFSGVSVSFNEVSSLWNEKNTYFAGDILPKENNLTMPEGYTLHGWYINDNYDTIYTSIPTDMSGEITVRPHLEPTVTWDLGIYGEWVSGNPPFTVATYGEVQTLPDVSAITVNNTVSFYQWTIDGIEATSIEANRTRPVKVIAQYKYANELLFGAFPQSSTDYSADDPIRWIVLSTDNNKQLLISERVLNEMQFASGDVRYFGGTPVKNWLNDEFYNKSFKDFEKDAISDNIINESYYHEDQGFTVITYPTTTCKVRLLSRDEWNGYRPPVSYDNTHGTEKNYWTCTYVGRYDTPTWYKNIYMYDAETNNIVTNSKYNQSGVRPVINIDLNNEFFNATESNITWQLGEDVGFFEGSTWNYFVKYREGYEQKLPTDGNFAVKPNGKVLIGWFVDDGTKLIAARSVPKEMRGDITLTPIWGTEGQKLIKYNLYNKDTGEYGRFTTEPPYVYTPGTALTLPDVSTVETPSGELVARWQRDNNVVTHIPSTETSDVEVFADFNTTGVCKIGYDLGNGHFNIATPSERVIDTDFIIPASTSVVPPVGYKFSHWILKTESGDILSDNATYVSGEYVGNVNVVAVYDNLIYNITWDLGPSRFVDGFATPSTYTYDIEYIFPDSNKVIALTDKILDHWEIDGVRTTKLIPGDIGPKTIKAIYSDRIIWFGTYPQSSTDSNVVEPIKWVALSNDGYKKYVVSDRVLDKKQFHNVDYTPLSYLDSSLKTWLNTTFLNKAFENAEQDAITDKSLISDNCKILILSGSDCESVNYPMPSYDNHYVTIQTFWLRDISWVGHYRYPDVCVGKDVTKGAYDANHVVGVRPSMNIDLLSDYINAPERNITWQIGTASFLDGSTWPEWTKCREGYGHKLPTDGNFATRPDGKVLIGWLIDNGVYKVATHSIPSDMRGDITLKPIWGIEGQKLVNYNLYNEVIDEYGRFTTEPSYVYTPGTALTLPDVSTVETPSGESVARWQINDIVVTEISSMSTTDVEVVANYNVAGTYKIVYDLGNGHFNIATPSERVIGTNFILPASTSVVPPFGYKFSHWILKTESGDILSDNATYVSGEYVGNVNVVATYDNLIYNITWDLGSGRFVDGFATPSTYTYDIEYTFPLGKVVAPEDKAFNHWEIDGIKVDKLIAGDYGDKTIKAFYHDKYMWFGTYPQSVRWQSDGSAYDAVEPIKWIMLDNDGAEALLVADKILDNVTYQSQPQSVVNPRNSWETSEMKVWLENTFYNKAFSTNEEKAGVINKATLLSAEEARNVKYFANNNERKVDGTEYAKTLVNVNRTLHRENGYCRWWLRDGQGGELKVGMVEFTGEVRTGDSGFHATDRYIGVRPVIHVDLSSPILKATESNITWQLRIDTRFINETTWTDWNKYREGFEHKLPTEGNFSAKPDGKVLIGWLIDNGTYKVAAHSIPKTMRGDITLTPIWGTAEQKIISYDLYNDNTGECGRFTTEPQYVYIPGTAVTLPNTSTVETLSGSQVTNWRIDGVDVLEIPSTSTGDVQVKAMFTDSNFFRVDFDLIGGSFVSGFSTPSEYERGVGLTLPTSADIDLPPMATGLSHYILSDIYGNVINENTTEISDTQVGYVKATAVYEYQSYNIDWQLGTDVSWKIGYVASASYTYNTGLTLPDASVLNLPTGKGFLGWNIRQVGKPDILNAQVIEPLSIGDVTVVAHYNDESFAINWELGNGHFISGFATPSNYRGGTGLTLPTGDKVVPPRGMFFDHFEIDGIEVTSIPADAQGEKTIVAKYRYDYIWFGTYPQNDASGIELEPIKWRVLSRNNSEMLLLAENILDNVSYYDGNTGNVRWANSALRRWLDETFKNKAFTTNQIDLGIMEKTIPADEVSPNDKVFLLSKDESNSYFETIKDRIATASNYAKNVDNDGVRLSVDTNGHSPWWLRTRQPASLQQGEGTIKSDGDLEFLAADLNDIGVRPAIYVSLSTGTIKTSDNHISFNLNGATWRENSKLWAEMTTYQGGQKLPTSVNLNLPSKKYLAGWAINGDPDNIVTEIPKDETGDIELVAVFEDYYDIWFGMYPQSVTWQSDGSTYDVVEPIKWRMLNYDGREAFLVADKVLDNVTYRSVNDNEWEDSHLKPWLENTFYNKAFSTDEEKASIKNNVSILLQAEANNSQYFANNDARKALATEYAKTVVNGDQTLSIQDGYSLYWLRDGGGSYFTTGVVEYAGGLKLGVISHLVTDRYVGVRPVFNIDLTSPLLSANESNVTWQIGTASFLNESTWPEWNKYREGFEHKLPTDGNFNEKPDGKVLIGWLIDNGIYSIATYSIPSDMRGDITLKPIWGTAGQKLINYDLYNETIGEYGRFTTEPPYVYTPGTALTLPDVSTAEDLNGNAVSSWKIDGVQVTEIPSTATSDVEIKADFNPDTGVYKVEFDMGDGHLTIATPSNYTYGTGLTLPVSINVVPPIGKTFSHWDLKDANRNIISGNVTEISNSQRGYVKVVAVYKNTSYTINWDLRGGQFIDGFATPSEYTHGTEFTLPTSDKVVSPFTRQFDHFEIDGVEVTSITKDSYGDKTVVAVYNYDYLWFGTYPQNDTEGKRLEPIKWRIISQDDDSMLLLAENILDNVSYEPSADSSPVWGSSHLNTWLNDEFLNKAFTANQINDGIVDKTITTGTETSTDKVMLLSDDDINNYLYSSKKLSKATASDYAKSVDNDGNTLTVENGNSPWWLRDRQIVTSYYSQMTIDADGNRTLSSPNSKVIGVRPAIYVDLSNNIIKTSGNNIHFNLNGTTWREDSKLWAEMTTYQGGQKLPTGANLNLPSKKYFAGWVNVEDPDTILTEIPKEQTGDIELFATFADYHDIYFGTYPQSVTWQSDGSTYNAVEPIKWRMLNYDGAEALLIADKLLDNVSFSSGTNRWRDSSVRTWLNNTFYNKAFLSDEEKEGLNLKTIETNVKGTSSPDITSDYVFFLTKEEARNSEYFANNNERQTKGTSYAKSVLNDGHRLYIRNGYGHYWLRSYGDSAHGNNRVSNITEYGSVDENDPPTNKDRGVRPVICVDLLSPIFNAKESNVTWQIGTASFLSDSTWREITKYREGIVNKLPVDAHFSAKPEGKVLIGWLIDNGTYKIATYSIPSDMRGDITLKPIWGTSGQKLINYDLYNEATGQYGIFATEPPYVYTPGVVENLPNPMTVVDPTGIEVYVWQINGEDVYDIPSTSTTDVKVKAIFNDAGINKVEFDMGGGHLTISTPSQYTYGVGLSLPASTSVVAPFAKKFSHWSLKDLRGNIISENATEISGTQRGYVNVVAVYNYATYTINYNNVIAGATIDNTSFERTYGSLDTVLASPSKTDYTFVGWYRDYDEATHTYENEYTGNDDIYVQGATNYTIYAKWKAKVTYNVNGHGVLPAVTPEYTDVDLWNAMTLATLSDVIGYTFDLTHSWYDGSDISTASFIGSAGSDYTVTEPKILYARWNENIYDVNYHMDGGSWKANAYNKATRSYTERLTLPTSDDIEKVVGDDAYEFDGWWTKDGNVETDWGVKVELINEGVSQDVDVYAKWKSTVSFNANGHGTAPASVEISGTQDIRLSSLSEIGWTFGGWYKSATEFTDDNFVGFGGDTITFNGPRILYARWKAIIIYNVNCHGAFPTGTTERIDVDDGHTITLETLSDVIGWTFDTTHSWYDGSDISTASFIGSAG